MSGPFVNCSRPNSSRSILKVLADEHRQTLVVEIQPGVPEGEGENVPNHPAVRVYRDRHHTLLKYVVNDVEHNQPAIRDLAYDWMTARPGVGMEKNDLEAVKLLKEWCTWLVAIETGIIAGLGVMQKDIQ